MPVLIACLMDLALGDPPWLPHPVRLIGRLTARLEAVLRPRKPVPVWDLLGGTLLTLFVVGLSYAGAVGITGVASAIHPWFGRLVSACLIFTTIAFRSLKESAHGVHECLDAGNLPLARARTAMIVGRDTAGLDEAEIARAVVETVAENTVDAVVSPLFYAALGGAPAAVAYRAVNTLDSMVGYKNTRYLYFGRASARLDDLANFVPARIGAILIVMAAMLTRRDWRRAWRTLLRDGRNHPSPNSGQPEAAMSGAIGVRLGGLNYYGGKPSFRPYIGWDGSPALKGHIREATTLLSVASHAAAILAVAGEVIGAGLYGWL
ncbi:MAG: cobalamin biosynthesis protein CobD [Firmicutes bacterium]|nr:cobalamin biosynthesis protein CobD [Bacillota bacterium]